MLSSMNVTIWCKQIRYATVNVTVQCKQIRHAAMNVTIVVELDDLLVDQ